MVTIIIGDRTVRVFYAGGWVATVIHADGWECSAPGRSRLLAVCAAWERVEFMVEHKRRWSAA